MAFGFKRLTDLSSLSLKSLNDQVEQIWIKTMGGIGEKDLSSNLQNTINSKMSKDDMSSIISQSEEEIKLMVGKTGGDNLIVNPTGHFGMNGWIGSGRAQNTNSADGLPGFVVGDSGTLAQYNIRILPDKKYTFGFTQKGKEMNVAVYGQSAGQGVDGQAYEHVLETVEGAQDWTERSFVFQTKPGQSTVYVQFSCDQRDADLRRIFLTEGDNVPGYSQNPNEIVGSGVKIDQNSVNISTPEFKLDLLNEEGGVESSMSAKGHGFDKIICQNISLRGRDLFGQSVQTLYVDAESGLDSNDGSSRTKAYKTIGKALKNVPLSHYDVKIYLNGQSYYENLVFDMGGNGSIRFLGEGAKLFGSMELANCSHVIHCQDLSIYSRGNFAVKSTAPGSMIMMENCLLDGGGNNGLYGGYFAYGSKGMFSRCEINNCKTALQFSYLSMGAVFQCTGRENVYGLYVTDCGLCIARGTVPYAEIFYAEENGGAIIDKNIISGNFGNEYEEPLGIKTVEYPATEAATYSRVWEPGVLKQGMAGDYPYYAFLLFDREKILREMAGKEILSVKLHVRRKTTDDPAAVKKLHLISHNNEVLSGSNVKNTIEIFGNVAKALPGEEVAIALPTYVIEDFETWITGFAFVYEQKNQEYELELCPLLEYNTRLEVQYH